jgi:hypothetical protein
MYEYVDRPIAALDPGSRLLVWAMRHWVAATTSRRCAQAAIGPAFAKFGALDALPHFHMSLMILSREASQQLSFAPLHCLHVGEDEALLLRLFASRGHHHTLQGTLALIVDAAAVSSLRAAMTATALSLEMVGLLPIPPAPLPSHGVPGE